MTRRTFKIVFALVFLLIPISSGAQTRVLALKEVVGRLVEVNYTLERAGLLADQARENISISQFTPTVGVTLRQSQVETSSITNTLGATAAVNWRLFDGLGMFATYDLSKARYNLALLDKRETLEGLLSDVAQQYYLIISLKNRLDVAIESVDLSRLRYREARLRSEIGASSGLEAKLAKTDLNADSSNMIRQREALDVAYITMNAMLQFDPTDRSYIVDSIDTFIPVVRENIVALVEERNTQLLKAHLGVDMSDLALRLARSARYPTLDFAAGYNYGASDAGNPQSNGGALGWAPGFNWGFTIGANLFNGLETQKRVRAAKIDTKIAEVTIADTENTLKENLSRLWINYTNNMQQITFERENASAMRLNLDVALERYRLGDLSGIDLRIIQQQYLDAVDRKINVLYQAKASEISLLTLAGSLF